MRLRMAGALVAGCWLAAALPAAAHHSFAAEFDVTRPITLKGVVTKMQFSNPHSWIFLKVTTDDGQEQDWQIEGAAPNALLRRGFNRHSLPVGTVVVVKGFQARDRSFRAAGRQVTLENGASLFVGSSGVGAPPEPGHSGD